MPQIVPRSNAPQIKGQVFYSYAIFSDGQSLGTLQEFAPSSSRRVERVREVLQSSGSYTKHMIPSTTDHKISLQRVELYGSGSTMRLPGLGNDTWASIEDQVIGLGIMETIKDPVSGKKDSYTYEDCWVTNASKTVSTTAANITMRMDMECARINAMFDQ